MKILCKNFCKHFNKFYKLKYASFSNDVDKSIEELKEVKNLNEFKQGISYLNEFKYDLAEMHFKESLKILKNINRTETLSYIYILKKYIQCLFFLRRFDQCEKTMQASIELSKSIFRNKEIISFPYYRNLIAFYTYTNITKASTYI
jgi:hypothetical protein